MKGADVEQTERAHAKYSASGSERWLKCSASVAMSAGLPEPPESDAAAEGTAAHLCLEMYLKNGAARREATRQMLLGDNPKERVNHTENAALELWHRHSLMAEGTELLSETKIDLSFVAPGMWGTADAVIVDMFGTLQVWDYKHGAGIAVDADENSQLAYYALGVAHLYDYNFTDVLMGIIQPRANHHSGETVRTVTMTIDELRGWEKVFRDGVEAAESPFAEPVAGKWCRWCPAKHICPALSTSALDGAGITLAVAAPPKPETLPEALSLPVAGMLPAESLGRILHACDHLTTWIGAVKDHAFLLLKSGQKVPGWKLVEKQARRQWDGDCVDEARKTFGLPAFTEPELLSPAQLEKLKPLKKDVDPKKWVAARVKKESSGLTLAPDSDRRRAFSTAESDCDVVVDVEPVQVQKDIIEVDRAPPSKRKAPLKAAAKEPLAKAKPKAKVKAKSPQRRR